MLGKTRFETRFGLTDRLTAVMAALAAAAWLVSLAAVAGFVLPRWGQTDFLRLHYTARWGVDWVAEWWNIAVFPAVGGVILLINGWLAGRLARQHRALAFLVYAATAANETLVAAASVLVVILNR
ncbi:MAG: hypothetical protein PHT12_01880 [Patescibacteria group bacterium]|nr:hypothetical protein [Patescibacteria group bacterium]